ncbi:hypothetical protein [Acidaminobacterium chupaoyuni]
MKKQMLQEKFSFYILSAKALFVIQPKYEKARKKVFKPFYSAAKTFFLHKNFTGCKVES